MNNLNVTFEQITDSKICKNQPKDLFSNIKKDYLYIKDELFDNIDINVLKHKKYVKIV